MNDKDRVYSIPLNEISDFKFDKAVSDVFDDMAIRSIPFYKEVQRMTAELILEFYQENRVIYDLGSSLGEVAQSLSIFFNKKPFRYIGIDNSEEMVKKAQSIQEHFVKKKNHSISFKASDIVKEKYENTGVFILNYTLQFIHSTKRVNFLKKLYNSLLPGGILILSEKVIEKNQSNSELFHKLYYSFKKRNGYSDLEISQKREALDNVLVPSTLEKNQRLLLEAGFNSADVFFKWYNFSSLIAIKT